MNSPNSTQFALKSIYRNVRSGFSRFARLATQIDKKILNSYFEKNPTHGLHIGCGNNFLYDFLNTDLEPAKDNIFQLDATKPFPFQDNSFDYIFSEHMIEHIPYIHGIKMLQECQRVLKTNGLIRITTPDIEKITKLLNTNLSSVETDYISWASGQLNLQSMDLPPNFIVNNFFRDWGHQFIYSRATLVSSLRQCGFTNIEVCEIGQSRHARLRNLENTARMPEGFLAFESFTLEARRP